MLIARAGCLVAALAIGPALAAGDQAEGLAAGEGSAPGAPQARIEELIQQVRGMEEKLKDSAAARKTADQARMEAERRLAEGTQEIGRQGAEIALLRDAKLALEERLARAEGEASASAQAQTVAEEAVRRLTVQRDAEAERASDLERQLKELQVQGCRAETAGGELARLKDELSAAEVERDALKGQLDSLRSAATAVAAGSPSPAEAKAAAVAAAATLREALARAQGALPSAQGLRAVREAEQLLYRRQSRVARLTGARGLYRVRPGDSLALVASLFYGDSARWREIYEANRDLLPDLDHPTPGTTLVIP